MRRERNLGNLLARARSGEELHMHLHLDEREALVRFDCIVYAYENRCALEDGDLEFLIGIASNYTVPGQEGRPPGWCRDERQWELSLAKQLLEVGKEEYRAALGLERVRDEQVELKLRTSAVRLLKQHCPQSAIERDDLYRFRRVRSAAVAAHVDEQMPEAKAKMQGYGRALARSRDRAQQREGAALR